MYLQILSHRVLRSTSVVSYDVRWYCSHSFHDVQYRLHAFADTEFCVINLSIFSSLVIGIRSSDEIN